jgi:hypothetical protein
MSQPPKYTNQNTQQWQINGRASTPYFTDEGTLTYLKPEDAVYLAQEWRMFEANHYTLSQLMLSGASEKKMASRLKWDIRSLRVVTNYLKKRLRLVR